MSDNKKIDENIKLELDNYELEQCRCCERQFIIDPKFPRKNCIVCWKKEKKYKLSVSDKQIVWLQQAIDDNKTGVQLNKGGISKTTRQLLIAEEKLAKKDNELLKLQNEIIHQNEIIKHTRKLLHKNAQWLLTSKRIKTLLKFVHPDKVDDKDKGIARGITCWLLNYLDKRNEVENQCRELQKKTGIQPVSKYPTWHSKHNKDINI